MNRVRHVHVIRARHEYRRRIQDNAAQFRQLQQIGWLVDDYVLCWLAVRYRVNMAVSTHDVPA